MAYALRYYKEISQTDGSAVRLEIHKKDSTASAVEIGAVVQVLSLEIQGQQGDIDTPIQKTSLHMTFVDAKDIENGQKNGFWEEFYTPDALLWKVILKAKDAEETAFRTIWGGYVTPDSFSEDLVYRGSVSITARDNIGHMQDFPFDALGDADGMISLRNLVEGGWEKIASPMQLILNPQFTLYCDGVPAYDTLMNVSAFEGMDWYKAIESALASYGMVMRYTGDNIVHVGALRFMPHFGWVDVESMPHVEPTFITGATRELVPAVKRIEENVDYKVGPLVCEPVQPTDFTGDVESFLIEGNSVDYKGVAWTIKNRTSGSGWCNPELSLFFNPHAYEFGDERNTDKDVMWLSANSYNLSSYFARYAEYSRYINTATKISFDARFGSPYYFAINGKMYAGNDIIKSCLVVIKVINEGSTYYLQSDGEWGNNAEKLNIEVSGSSLFIPIVLSSFPGTSLVCVQIHQILTEAAARSSARYIPLYSAQISQQTPIREKNTVNTLYNADNNVILSRDPELGPAFDRVALPDFIKNGIFYREGNEVLPARLWAWSGGSEQQMAVYNHLQLLCYYAKPNNFISGTIVKTDVSRMGNIWMWHGAEHILVSGRYNFLNGHIESAVLREFARYEDMWTEVSGAGLPDTEQESRTNVEGSSTGSSSAPSYTSTTTVNIGSGGGGGGTGASYLNDLLDVNVANAGAQSLLYYNGTEWIARSFATLMNPYLKSDVAQETYATKASLATLEAAVQDNAGNIKKNFDAIGALQIGKADKATTLAGYGIKDAYTKTETDNLLAKYVLLNAANQTIKGDIRIEGNLVVTGDTASGGTSGGGGTSIGVSGIFVNGETRRDDDGDGIIVLDDYPTSLEWSAINGKPTKLSEFTDDILAGKYLPLAGGSISGNLAVQGQITTNTLFVSGQNGMTVSRLVTSVVRSTSSIEFQANNGTLGKANSIRLSTGQLAPIGEDKELISLGNASARWKDVYAVGGDFSGVLNVQGLVAQEAVVSAEGSDMLVINRLNSTTSPTTITYKKDGGLLGRMGFNTDGAPVAQVSGTYQTLLHSGNYSSYALPLSGGTIAGNGTGLFAINRKDGNPVIEFHYNGSLMGRYGFATDGTPIGVVAGSQVTLIHSGNIGSYAVIKAPYPTSGGNYNYAFESGLYSTNAVEEGLPISEAGNIVVNANYDSKASAQLYMRTSSDALYYRRKRSGTWYAWKTLAFTDSDITGNAATATKLQTARTLWGQSFDGTGNVTGNLYLGSNILYGGNNYNILDISGGSGLNIGYGIRSVGSTVYWAKSHAFYVGDSHALTINSSGNVGIGTASPEYKLDVVGKARVSDELIVTYPTGFRWAYGDYGVLFRNDANKFYILLTDAGGALSGSWNALRPFAISLTTGDVTMGHNLDVKGTIKSSSLICGTSRLRVNSPTNAGVFGFMDAQLFQNTTNVASVHIGSCYGGSTALDNTTEYPSGVSMTAISIYRGRVGIGKRWSDTELRALHDANCSLGVLNNAHIMGNLAVSSIYSDNGQSGAAGVVLRNEGGIEISHASTPYIDFHFANSTSDFNHRLIAKANNIFAYSGNYFCPWGSESLGASSYRWQYVYAKAGSFSNDMEINGALTVGAGATFNGDVRINGNLVVTGDTASGGAGQETTSTSLGAIELDMDGIIGYGGQSNIATSVIEGFGLTSQVIDNMLQGKYTKVIYNGTTQSSWTYEAYRNGGDIYIYIHQGGGDYTMTEVEVDYDANTGKWKVYFREI